MIEDQERTRNPMHEKSIDTYLYCAMSIGEELLKNGAEVGRVEDTIQRICMAYGALRVDVFSITSSIVTTVYGQGFETHTQTRRISERGNNLHRLDELNRLSRWICQERPSADEIMERLDEIKNGAVYSFGWQLLIYALVSGSFSVFFGGDFKDMLASALIGISLKFMESFLKHYFSNSMVTALLCSVAGGFLANAAVRTGMGSHVDLISIGNVMLFIPGLAFTNSLRDMFSGDTATGLLRFMESCLLAMVIAIGFTLPNFLF